jgi:putative Mg2+ transporter-C (MgtC) family protein
MIILQQIFDPSFIFFISRLALAMVLGLLLGLERVYAHKTVGMRTYALVTVSSAIFISVSLFVGDHFMQFASAFNPAFIAGNIIVGVGFLGAGLILHNKDGHIENLTTSGGLWACAGVGMMVGFNMWKEAIFASFLIFFVLGIMSVIERAIRLKFYPDPVFEKQIEKKSVQPTKTRIKKVTP